MSVDPVLEGKRALVFDMDGTIVDNMSFHTQAWMQTLADLGLEERDPVLWEQQTSGVPNREIFRDILALPLDDAGIDHWVKHKEALYRVFAENSIVEIDGFTDFLGRCLASKIEVGLATGAGAENIAFNLKAMGLESAFACVVGAADVFRGKPNPEIFLTAAQRLGALGGNVIVFEDAPLGIEAAKAANMPVVGVTTMMTDSELSALPGVFRTISGYANLDPVEIFAAVSGVTI